jgi:hypothetical protein
VEPTAEFAHLQPRFTDPTQRRYEVIRPLLLFADRTATQRAQETEIHPDTVRMFLRRFRQEGVHTTFVQKLSLTYYVTSLYM